MIESLCRRPVCWALWAPPACSVGGAIPELHADNVSASGRAASQSARDRGRGEAVLNKAADGGQEFEKSDNRNSLPKSEFTRLEVLSFINYEKQKAAGQTMDAPPRYAEWLLKGRPGAPPVQNPKVPK